MNDHFRGAGMRRTITTLGTALLLGLAGAPVDRRGFVEAQVAIGIDTVPAEAAPADAAVPADPDVDIDVDGAEDVKPLTPEDLARNEIAQMAAQYEPLLLRVLYDHLELLRTLEGDLPPETRLAISAAGEAAVKDATPRLIEEIRSPRPLVPAPPAGEGESIVAAVAEAFGFAAPRRKPAGAARAVEPLDPPFDACQLVVDAVSASVVERLGEVRGADFVAEVAGRERRRRAAEVRRLVAILDEELTFSAGQRDAIEEALGGAPGDAISTAIDRQVEYNGRKLYPGLPYERVLPHLSPVQRDRLGDGGECRDFIRSFAPMETHARFFRRANLSQSAERDPWWYE